MVEPSAKKSATTTKKPKTSLKKEVVKSKTSNSSSIRRLSSSTTDEKVTPAAKPPPKKTGGASSTKTTTTKKTVSSTDTTKTKKPVSSTDTTKTKKTVSSTETKKTKKTATSASKGIDSSIAVKKKPSIKIERKNSLLTKKKTIPLTKTIEKKVERKKSVVSVVKPEISLQEKIKNDVAVEVPYIPKKNHSNQAEVLKIDRPIREQKYSIDRLNSEDVLVDIDNVEAEDFFDREQLFFRAKMFEAMNSYENMQKTMVELAQRSHLQGLGLTLEERQALIVAVKSNISQRRTARKKLGQLMKSISSPFSSDWHKLTNLTLENLESRIKYDCNYISKLILEDLLPYEKTIEGIAFFFRYAADMQRYLCSVGNALEQDRCKQLSKKYYQKALNILNEDDDLAYHSTTLSTSLNYALFLKEQEDEKEKATELCRETYIKAADAIAKSNFTYCETHRDYKETIFLLLLLKNNADTWSSEIENERNVFSSRINQYFKQT